MHKPNWPLFFCFLAFLCTFLFPVSSSADPGGQALAEKVYDRPNGRDLTTLGWMVLIEKGHAPRERVLVTYRLEKTRRDTAYLVRFLDPEDISGTGLLVVDEDSGEANQWLYLPALDRVRRISSGRKGGRFVGSDFYYEDLEERHPEEDVHRIVGEESVSGVVCRILESTPVNEDNSVYSKRVSWIDPQTLLPMRVDYYEKNANTPSKRFHLIKKARVQGYWTIMRSGMTDLKSGHETQMIADTVIYDRRLPESLFSTRALADENLEAEYRP
jgi:Outer membrane lipoprotein-sorting protein